MFPSQAFVTDVRLNAPIAKLVVVIAPVAPLVDPDGFPSTHKATAPAAVFVQTTR